MAIHPAVIKNTFLSHLVLWVVFLPLLSYILLPLILTDLNIDPEEMEFVTTHVSDIQKVTERANRVFSSMFVKTGMVSATENFFGGDPETTSHSPGTLVGRSAAAWAGEWIHGVWTMIYKSIWRFNALMTIAFFPTLVLCIAAIVDGFASRAKKRYNFERSNQVFFYTSTHTAVLMIGMLVFLPIVPIPLTGHVIAGFMATLALSLWYATNNFQTGT